MSFPPEAVADLARQYGFHPSYSLAEELEETARRYEFHRRISIPTYAGRRKAGARVHKRTLALLEAIRELDESAGSFMVDHELRAGLVLLASSTAEHAAALKGDRSGGSTPDYARRWLVTDLVVVYRGGTGKKYKYTQKPGTNEYSGPFIDFAIAATALLGVVLSPSFIAETFKGLERA
jgi:hypothetical protein